MESVCEVLGPTLAHVPKNSKSVPDYQACRNNRQRVPVVTGCVPDRVISRPRLGRQTAGVAPDVPTMELPLFLPFHWFYKLLVSCSWSPGVDLIDGASGH